MLWENDTPTPPARLRNADAIIRQLSGRPARQPSLWRRTLATVRAECQRNTALALFWLAVQLAALAGRIGGRP